MTVRNLRLISHGMITLLVCTVIGLPFVLNTVSLATFLLTLFFLFFVIERIGEIFFAFTADKGKADRTFEMVVLTYCIVLFCSYVECMLTFTAIGVVNYIGLFMFLIAFAMRWYSFLVYNTEFRVNIQTKPNKLLTHGMFKYLRNPNYISCFVEMLAVPLLLTSYYSCIVSLCIIYPVFIYRAKREEKILEQEFGQKYLDYKMKTPAYLPTGVGFFKAMKELGIVIWNRWIKYYYIDN